MIYEIFSSKALHMNSKICIEISVEVQETAQPVFKNCFTGRPLFWKEMFLLISVVFAITTIV